MFPQPKLKSTLKGESTSLIDLIAFIFIVSSPHQFILIELESTSKLKGFFTANLLDSTVRKYILTDHKIITIITKKGNIFIII